MSVAPQTNSRRISIGLAELVYDVVIDGEPWSQGDMFFVKDRHGVPWEQSFQYWNKTTDTLVCYNWHRHGTHACGFYAGMPSRTVDSDMSGDNLRFAQLCSIAIDLGIDVGPLRRDWPGMPASGRARILEKLTQLIDEAEEDP